VVQVAGLQINFIQISIHRKARILLHQGYAGHEECKEMRPLRHGSAELAEVKDTKFFLDIIKREK
jgi:hypothetical protein